MKAFASISLAIATKMSALTKLYPADSKVTHVEFAGVWSGRKFVIGPVSSRTFEHGSIAVDVKDLENGTIALAVKATMTDPHAIVSTLRGFGAVVTRKSQMPVRFDVVEGFDRALHIVAGHHHVALCGHKGPWPDSVHEGVSATCAACSEVAKTKPAYRARFHPLAVGNRA